MTPDTQTAYVLVPSELADEMLIAALRAGCNELGATKQQADAEVSRRMSDPKVLAFSRAQYAAMLSAAPKPPESEIGPVAWGINNGAGYYPLTDDPKTAKSWPEFLGPPAVNLYPQARIDADAATIAALRAEAKSAEVMCDSYADENQRLFDRAEAAEARVKELEAAIGGCLCPRPFNSRPHGFTIAECVGAGECGCGDGEALASKTATDDDRETEIQWRNRDEDDLRDSIERERDE